MMNCHRPANRSSKRFCNSLREMVNQAICLNRQNERSLSDRRTSPPQKGHADRRIPDYCPQSFRQSFCVRFFFNCACFHGFRGFGALVSLAGSLLISASFLRLYQIIRIVPACNSGTYRDCALWSLLRPGSCLRTITVISLSFFRYASCTSLLLLLAKFECKCRCASPVR